MLLRLCRRLFPRIQRIQIVLVEQTYYSNELQTSFSDPNCPCWDDWEEDDDYATTRKKKPKKRAKKSLGFFFFFLYLANLIRSQFIEFVEGILILKKNQILNLKLELII